MNKPDCLSHEADISWQVKPVNMINKNIAENVKNGNIKQVNERSLAYMQFLLLGHITFAH